MRSSTVPPIPLTHLLLAPDDRVVAVDDGAQPPRTRRDLHADVRALVARLRARPAWRRCGLCCDDAYTFAVAWLALLHERRTVVMPANGQPGTLADLAAQVDVWFGDLDPAATAGIVMQHPLNGDAQPADAECLATVSPHVASPDADIVLGEVARDGDRIELFTSGSTGDRQVARKSVGQLADETMTQARLWQNDFRHTTVVGSVSHQHIYGLLFRILVPLALGLPFERRTLVFPDRLATALRRHAPCVLISCPAHLERLPALIDLPSLQPVVRVVVSSGSLLERPVAEAIRAALHVAPTEVLGSTETGGVAWRRQSPDMPAGCWTPLPGVRLRLAAALGTADALEVASPWTAPSPTADVWVGMGDRATLHDDGTFILLGRHDRIAKIGGKRLSLNELEHRLVAHADVAEAAATTLAEPGGREIVVVALVLHPAGAARLAADGRRAYFDTLRASLAAHLPAVHLPRRWRVVDTLPRDAQGKRPVALVRALFDTPPPSPSPRLLPHVRSSPDASLTTDGDGSAPTVSLCLSLTVPADLDCLRGHFPGHPVVPGVILVHWVMTLASQHLGAPTGLAAFDALKFHQPVRPDDALTLTLTWQPARQLLVFAYARDAIPCAGGRLTLRQPVAEHAAAGPVA